MVTIINNDTEQQVISPSYSIWKIALIGVALGVIYWGLTAIINRSINSVNIAGDISAIIVAVLGIFVMLRLLIAQPLIIALASGMALWGLANWTMGLAWGEAIAWSVLLYGLAYVLFSWIARYVRVMPVLAAMTIIIIIVRIVVAL